MPTKPKKSQTNHCEIFILAGGLSKRMGRDKSRLRIGPRTMLGHVRAVAKRTGLRVRVIRRDAVPRCGPLGGIYTAFKRSRAQSILFLACDMPFVTAELLKKLINATSPNVFSMADERAGFPFLLNREKSLPIVCAQIEAGEHSLQSLAKKLRAKTIRLPSPQLANINTPEELALVRQHLHG